MGEARLVEVAGPASPEGLVVVLHGGGSRGEGVAVSPAQLSVLRMIPVARRIARAGRRRLRVVRLLNSFRGWDTGHTPVDDARWAVDRLLEQHPGLPVALVGHSLGGRAALLAGEHEAVTTVVALNPWVYPTDDADLAGRRVLVLHGTDDRIASPDRSRTVATRLAGRADVSYVAVPGGKHAMLRHGGDFESRAARFVTDALLATPTPD